MRRPVLLFVVVFVIALMGGLAIGLLRLAQPPVETAEPQPTAKPAAVEGVLEGVIIQAGSEVPAVWVVDVYAVQVSPSTEIITNGLRPEPGVWARVGFLKMPTASIQATTIELQEPPSSTLFDRIVAMEGGGAGLWTVGDTKVEIGPDTIIEGTPAVGELAFVEGVRSRVGIRATQISIEPATNEVMFEGDINALAADTWQIDDVTVIPPDPSATHGNVRLGARAQVRGVEIAPRTVRTSEVWVSDDSGRYSVLGWLQSIEEQGDFELWRVSLLDGPRAHMVLVIVDQNTLLDDSQSSFNTGTWLQIVGARQSDAVYRARRITALPRASKRQFYGSIERMPAGGLTGEWVIAGYRVLTDENTAITGSPAVGLAVWVSGQPDYANVIHAVVIHVLSQ